MYLLSRFFVTKNKVMETDLQLAKAIELHVCQKHRAEGNSKQFLQSHPPLQRIMSRCFKEIW